jgi:hypothetical protein
MLTLSLAVLAQPANAGPDGPAQPTGADTVIWYEMTPVVVDPNVVQDVALEVQTSGSPIDGVKLRLANGGIVMLNNNGGGLFSTVLTHAQVLFGYAADDYNHNFNGSTTSTCRSFPMRGRIGRCPPWPAASWASAATVGKV